jgi:sodium transport system permease protein
MIADAFVIFRKEMRNLAKDRRTLILLLGLPILIMPLVFGTIGAVTASEQRQAAQTVYTLWIEGNDDPVFLDHLRGELGFTLGVRPADGSVGVLFPEGYRPGQPALVEVYYDSTSSRSEYAASRIEAALGAYSDGLAAARLRAVALVPEDLRTIQVGRVDQAPEEAQGVGFLAVLLPYLIVIYLFSGSMQIGLDCTAGERERGSLASVLVNQVSRTSIALGKVLYVVCAALMNGVASFAGIIIAFQLLGTDGSGGLGGSLAIFSAANVLGLLVVLLSLGLLAASIIVLLGSLAKTMREGGTYVLPVYLVAIVVGVAAMQMDPSRQVGLFFVPLVNGVFALKEILLAQANLLHLLLTVGVNLVAASVLIRLVAGLYNSERILDTV